MSEPDDEVGSITEVLRALSDPVRLEVVRSLALDGEERTCGDFRLPVTKSTASHHFKILREAGITVEKEKGTRKYLYLRQSAIDAAFPGLLNAVLHGMSATTPSSQESAD